MANRTGTFLSSEHSRNGGLRRMTGQQPLNARFMANSVVIDQYRNEIPMGGQDERLEHSSHNEVHFEPFDKDEQQTETPDHRPSYSGNPSSIELHSPQSALDSPPHDDFIRVRATQGSFQTFIWPALAICAPMILLSSALLFIVFRYRIRQLPNVFDRHGHIEHFADNKDLLVDYSATKLVFLASFLSTMAPLLAGCVMALTAVLVHNEMKKSSHRNHFPHLPTPYQMSLLIGVLAASYEQLFSSLWYLSSHKRTAKASPVLLYAISIFMLSMLLSVAVMATDAYLHVATQTVRVTVYSNPSLATVELGRALNSYCLGVDRIKDNNGYPCNIATTVELGQNNDFKLGQPEVQRIAHNASSASAMHLAQTNQTESGSIAYLMPEISLIPDQTNYMANTIGVASKCSLIPPPLCNLTRWNDGIYLSFNCSSQFWGTLGMPPTEAVIGGSKPISPYLSFLAISSNANLIYNYFADDDMEIVYNTADLNASAVQQDDFQPWPNDQLKNPIYMGLAWRKGLGNFPGARQNGMVQSDLVHSYSNMTYIDFFLKCKVTTYDVRYTWVNKSLQSLELVKHDNGSILNMWTGTADHSPRVSGSDWALQDYNVQSIIAGNTTSSYEHRFGEMISQDALAEIAAYTSGRQVLEQQDQNTMLVAKVPKSALWALLACSLLYPVLGITLLVKAKFASKETGPMPPIFSYWGLASAAFLRNRSRLNAQDANPADARPQDQEDAWRLFIRPNDGSGEHFGLWRRSRTGRVTEY